MISCPAYGLNITDVQCREARERFYLKPICGDCRREELEEVRGAENAPPESVESSTSRRGARAVLRTGPTIAVALQLPTFLAQMPALIFATSNVVPKINKKSTLPRRCPHGMTPAVARSLGLV